MARLSREKEARIRALLKAHATRAEVMREVGIARATVDRIADRMEDKGIVSEEEDTIRSKIDPEIYTAIHRSLDMGASVEWLANRLPTIVFSIAESRLAEARDRRNAGGRFTAERIKRLQDKLSSDWVV